MQNLPIKTSSEYEKAYNDFKSSDLAQKLSEKYRVRPFYEKYAKLYRAVSVASYGLNFFSVATATTCVFAFLMAMLPYPFLCACIAVASLTMIELFKRLTIPSFFQSYFQFKKLTISKLVFIIVLVVFSVTLSYTGAKDTVLLLTPKAELTDVQATKQPFSERIKSLEKQKRDIKRSMSWENKLTPQGAKAYNEVTAQIGRIENEMMQSVSKANTSNEKTLGDHQNNTSLRAEYFGAITLFLDLALIALFFFMELYQLTFRS
jgi:hypothetical protein